MVFASKSFYRLLWQMRNTKILENTFSWIHIIHIILFSLFSFNEVNFADVWIIKVMFVMKEKIISTIHLKILRSSNKSNFQEFLCLLVLQNSQQSLFTLGFGLQIAFLQQCKEHIAFSKHHFHSGNLVRRLFLVAASKMGSGSWVKRMAHSDPPKCEQVTCHEWTLFCQSILSTGFVNHLREVRDSAWSQQIASKLVV